MSSPSGVSNRRPTSKPSMNTPSVSSARRNRRRRGRETSYPHAPDLQYHAEVAPDYSPLRRHAELGPVDARRGASRELPRLHGGLVDDQADWPRDPPHGQRALQGGAV